MLEKLLAEKKTAILDRWFELILGTYPPEARRFFQEEKDRFANPVGRTIAGEICVVFDELREGRGGDRLRESLREIIRIRAVQDFAPSGAVAVVFFLKPAVLEVLAEELHGPAAAEFVSFEKRIDDAALLAFDLYMESRKKIADLRVQEIKARYRFLDRLRPMEDE